MKIKRRNKKAQNFTTGQLLGLILGVVIVVVVVLFVTDSFGYFSDLFGKADIDTTAIAQKCGILVSLESSGYCTDRIEIGKDSYVNCGYAVDKLGVKVEGSDNKTCSDDDSIAICQKLKLEKGDKYNSDKIIVNGISCTDWDVS